MLDPANYFCTKCGRQQPLVTTEQQGSQGGGGGSETSPSANNVSGGRSSLAAPSSSPVLASSSSAPASIYRAPRIPLQSSRSDGLHQKIQQRVSLTGNAAKSLLLPYSSVNSLCPDEATADRTLARLAEVMLLPEKEKSDAMTRNFHAEILAAHDFKERQKQSASRHTQDKLSCKIRTLKIEVGFWQEQSSDASKFQARHDHPSTPGSMRDALSQVLDKMKDADTSLPVDINIDTVSLLRVDCVEGNVTQLYVGKYKSFADTKFDECEGTNMKSKQFFLIATEDHGKAMAHFKRDNVTSKNTMRAGLHSANTPGKRLAGKSGPKDGKRRKGGSASETEPHSDASSDIFEPKPKAVASKKYPARPSLSDTHVTGSWHRGDGCEVKSDSDWFDAVVLKVDTDGTVTTQYYDKQDKEVLGKWKLRTFRPHTTNWAKLRTPETAFSHTFHDPPLQPPAEASAEMEAGMQCSEHSPLNDPSVREVFRLCVKYTFEENYQSAESLQKHWRQSLSQLLGAQSPSAETDVDQLSSVICKFAPPMSELKKLKPQSAMEKFYQVLEHQVDMEKKEENEDGKELTVALNKIQRLRNEVVSDDSSDEDRS